MLRGILPLLTLCAAPHCPGLTVFIAPGGDDSNPGTQEHPLKTLEAARDRIRDQPMAGGHRVILRGGIHSRLQALELEAVDSGRPGEPNIYEAHADEAATLVGGITVSASTLEPASGSPLYHRLPEEVRARILTLDLKTLGIPGLSDSRSASALPEFYCDGVPMRTARWPNTGYAMTGKVIRKGSVPRYWRDDMKNRLEYIPPDEREDPPQGAIFTYEGDRPHRWLQAETVRLFGFWKVEWFCEVLTVKRIDPEQHLIETVEPHVYGVEANRRYYVFDLPEELDAPGEFYIDRSNGQAYLYPFPTKTDAPRIHISKLEEPVIRMKGASNIIMRGLRLEVTGGDGIRISGGRDTLVAGCTIRNTGGRAVGIDGGSNHGVVACDVDTTSAGVTLRGGDRKTLTPAGHYARNNRINAFSRYGHTYVPGISLDGVGLVVANNEISGATHVAMRFAGNDHLIEGNEIHGVCTESDDMGSIYSGRNVTWRGTIIRNNYFHDIQTAVPTLHGTMGVYLDDLLSGTTLEGNIFQNVPIAMMINGGRDNRVVNNLFVDVNISVRLTDIGQHRVGRSSFELHGYGTTADPHTLKPPDATYNTAPYTRYPHLDSFLDDEPCWPKYNVVTNNVDVRSGGLAIHHHSPPEARHRVRELNTLEDPTRLGSDQAVRAATLRDVLVTHPDLIHAVAPRFKVPDPTTIGLQLDDHRERLACRPPALTPKGGRAYRSMKVRLEPSFLHGTNKVGVIHFTLDGSDPDASSPVYRTPLLLTTNTTINARLFPFAGSRWTRSAVASADFTVDEKAWLVNFEPVDFDCHGGLKVNLDYKDKPGVSIAGTSFDRSLLTCPRGETGFGHVTYALSDLPPFRRFTAVVGIEDFVGDRGSCEFIVEGLKEGGWRELYRSPVKRGGEPSLAIKADVTGCAKLRLKTTVGRDNPNADHAVWADALLE